MRPDRIFMQRRDWRECPLLPPTERGRRPRVDHPLVLPRADVLAGAQGVRRGWGRYTARVAGLDDPGQDPEAYPRIHSVLARRIRGGEYPAGPGCLRKQNWRTNSAAGPTSRPGAPGTPARRAGQEGPQTRVRIVRTGCSSRLATMHHPASARRPHPSRRRLHSRLPYSRVDRDHQQGAGFADARSRRDAVCPVRMSVYLSGLLRQACPSIGALGTALVASAA